MKDIYQKIIEIENSSQKAVVCTVISTKGSTPRKTGAKMLVFENKSIFGTIGGGALENKVIDEAVEVLIADKAKIVHHDLVNEFDMCCGGSVDVFMEPIKNKMKLHIFGAGHIGKFLAKIAVDLNFSVSLIDEREEGFENINSKEINCINEQHISAIEKLTFDQQTFVVVLTHDHAYDREIVALCSKKESAYLGMIGSQRKAEMAKKILISSDLISKEKFATIDSPIGFDINAITPEEIAVSILAKLISVRNQLNLD